MALYLATPTAIVSLPTPPASPAAGWLYFDSTNGQLYEYDGNKFAGDVDEGLFFMGGMG